MSSALHPEHVDVLVIGAGLSGIGAGYHLQTQCPEKRYAILEARSASGGTWDLFRYPGVRSDSDMYTLGYRFRPWPGQQAITDGASILQYIRDTAREFGIDRKIRYRHRVTRASWSSTDALWSVDVATDTSTLTITASVLYSCMGYYDYESGFTPDLPGIEKFEGSVVHPQQWPETLDYQNKRVVVIGSGATAVTLVPAMAKDAAHITMLQRSPTYVIAQPSRDRLAKKFRAVLPERTAYAATRWKNVALSIGSYWLARRFPNFMKRLIIKSAKNALRDRSIMKNGDAKARADDQRVVDAFNVDTHFNPSYKPWDQRMCLAPDADFFRSMKAGKAAVVTDVIKTFTPTGVQLESGQHLDADVIVTATGLKLRLLAGLELLVDGKRIKPSDLMVYKGMMFSDVPNFVSAFGYTNASWTLKVDLTADYTCRLLHYMHAHDFQQFTPRRNDPTITAEPVLDFTSGYVKRALSELPSQGSRAPWRVHQNYVRDLLTIRFGRLDDGVMEFR